MKNFILLAITGLAVKELFDLIPSPTSWIVVGMFVMLTVAGVSGNLLEE